MTQEATSLLTLNLPYILVKVHLCVIFAGELKKRWDSFYKKKWSNTGLSLGDAVS